MADKSKRTGWENMRQARLDATKEQRAIKAEKQREYRRARKEQGRCTRCGSIKNNDGLSVCPVCLLKVKLTRKPRAQKNKPYNELSDERKERIRRYRQKKYHERKLLGICVRCGQAAALPGLTMCMNCRLYCNQSHSGVAGHTIKYYTKERKAGRL